MKILTALFMLSFLVSDAQNQPIITKALINYERRFNLYSLPEFGEQKSLIVSSQFRVFRFSLSFDKSGSVYKPIPKTSSENVSRLGEQPAENNTVKIQYENQLYYAEKQIFDKKYIVSDTLTKINWKITDERRTIAGFDCRRANALLYDSIYVVAFYAEAIAVSGGPEQFAGLPGMILGVSLPHYHLHWQAYSISLQNDTPVINFNTDSSNKKYLSTKHFKDDLSSQLTKWPQYFKLYLLESLL